jgi:hypothetical protein
MLLPAAEAPLRGLPPLVQFKPPRCPVWRNSTAGPIDWARPMTGAQRKAWLSQLHAFDGQTKRARGPQGRVGNDGFLVIKALLFFQHRDGTLCPSKAAIAAEAKLSIRTTHDVLSHLRDIGVIGWQRRCKPGNAFPWVQDTSAYFFRPPSEWRGYRPDATAEPPPPPPPPEMWGACPPLPGAIDQWSELRKQGATAAARIAALQSDKTNGLALALAKLGGPIYARRDGKARLEPDDCLLRRRGNAANRTPD